MEKTVEVNEQVSALLHKISSKMKELHHPPLDVLTPRQSREYYKIARTYFPEIPVHGVETRDDSIRASQGHSIPVRIYTPSGRGNLPVLVYFHGGGWVFGDIDSADSACRYLAVHSEIIVVSVGYRLAPEHKFPAAYEDALESVLEARRQWPEVPLYVGGESSGGNLAAAVSGYYKGSRDVSIQGQLLITPVLNYDFSTDSYLENFRYNLTTEKMKWFFNHYLNNEEEGGKVEVSPLRMEDKQGLPETVLVTAHFDPLREEAAAYHRQLQEAGVRAERLHFEDLVHSFINMAGTVDRAEQALADTAASLKTMVHPNVHADR
ncbi:alpha/beta hydrolase [Halobacillus litoralis]|uniref:alpha/beta hydrolase n=1 Tax=Halobacillus litoralis TaxID=45668 RepID=UPI00136BD2FF|nr:alpha/beta hydrolase [Halobacillus litoralis]MYL39430.1 alpha/beta hydrolase fold domain-containing protein [Halobacillus litoralis]